MANLPWGLEGGHNPLSQLPGDLLGRPLRTKMDHPLLYIQSQYSDSVALGLSIVEPVLVAGSGHWAAGCPSALVFAILSRGKQILLAAESRTRKWDQLTYLQVYVIRSACPELGGGNQTPLTG